MISIIKDKWKELLLSIFLLISFQPFYVWHTKTVALVTVLMALLILFSGKMREKNAKNVFLIVVLIFLYSYVSIKGGYTIIGYLVNLCILSIVLIKREKAIDIYNVFYKIFSIIIFLSLITYCIVVILGVNLPSSSIPPLNEGKEEVAEYFRYPFLVVYYSYGILLPRFCGLFDEPGVVGTIAAFILVLNKFNLKDYFNYPVLIAGILSFSLFFYITTFVYIFIFGSTRVKISMVVIFAALLVLFAHNEIVNDMLFKRIVFSDNTIITDNRKLGLSPTWYKTFKESSSYYWGLGNQAHLKYNSGGSSYVDLIIDYGIIFFFIFCSTFVVSALYRIKNKKNLITFFVLFAGIIYQRPFITMTGYFYLLYAPIVILSFDTTSIYKKANKKLLVTTES